jgi:hypothetical protein
MAGDISDEEAAWRDLVAHYRSAAAPDGAAPWPVREDLTGGQRPSPDGPGPGELTDPGPGELTDPGPGELTDPGPGELTDPGPGELTDPGPGELTDPGLTPLPPAAWPDPVPGVIPAPPQMRIIRPASPVPPTPLQPSGDDEHYIPPPPPPLPQLDPLTKGAWVALFGGPGYLLLAVLLGWVVPGWAAFTAVAAFVGGFATLVVRMGERPPRDSGPDDGAVV